MKKLLFILLIYPAIFYGQEKSFELGLSFSGSLNSFNGDPEFAKKTLQPVGGILMQYNFNDRFSLKSKLLYHIKGGKGERNDVMMGDYNHRLDFYYATLPLLAQWNFSKERWIFYCNIGSYIGYLTRVENVFDGEYISQINTARFEMDLENYNRLDFGLTLGSGLSFQMYDRIKIFLEFSFDHALVNISALQSNNVVLSQAITGSLGMAYNFPIKKKTFNGNSTLKCADYNEVIEVDDKKKSKWRLVLYKDGKRVGNKSKRGKSRLFKKKN